MLFRHERIGSTGKHVFVVVVQSGNFEGRQKFGTGSKERPVSQCGITVGIVKGGIEIGVNELLRHELRQIRGLFRLQKPLGKVPIILERIFHFPPVKGVIFFLGVKVNGFVIERESGKNVHHTLDRFHVGAVNINVLVHARNGQKGQDRGIIFGLHSGFVGRRKQLGVTDGFALQVVVFRNKEGKPQNETQSRPEFLQAIAPEDALEGGGGNVESDGGFSRKPGRLDVLEEFGGIGIVDPTGRTAEEFFHDIGNFLVGKVSVDAESFGKLVIEGLEIGRGRLVDVVNIPGCQVVVVGFRILVRFKVEGCLIVDVGIISTGGGGIERLALCSTQNRGRHPLPVIQKDDKNAADTFATRPRHGSLRFVLGQQ